MQVEPRGHEHELRREPARDEPLDRADRRGEARSRAHALVRGGGRAVDRDLDALHGERREAVGGGVVDAAAVGLELERDAGRREHVEDVPAMRHAERLAAAERDIGDAGVGDAPREVERLVARRARRPTPCPGPDSSQQAMQRALQRLVSCQARKRGARYSSTERPCIANGCGISGEADVRLRHHLLGDVLELGVSHAGFSPASPSAACARRRPSLVSTVSFDSLMLPPFGSACGNRKPPARYWPRA